MMLNVCFVLGLVCFGSTAQGLENREAVTALDPTTLKVFLKPFRESVLAMVASGWNETIEDSERLKADLQVCSDKIKLAVHTCEQCTAAACKPAGVTAGAVDSSSTLLDILLIAMELYQDPLGFLKGPLDQVGNKLGDLVDLLGDGSASFIGSMADLGQSVGDKFTDIFHGLESGVNKVKDTFSDLGIGALSGIKDVGGTIGDGFSTGVNSVGHALESAGHKILDGLGSVFGRRRQAAAVSAEIRQCMKQCSTCDPMLITDRRQMITSVCGPDVVRFNETVRKHVRDIKGVFVAVSDKVNPVIVKIEYDPISLSGTTFSTVYVTANVRGRYVRYQSTQAYDMVNYATSAHKMAAEFWGMWTR